MTRIAHPGPPAAALWDTVEEAFRMVVLDPPPIPRKVVNLQTGSRLMPRVELPEMRNTMARLRMTTGGTMWSSGRSILASSPR